MFFDRHPVPMLELYSDRTDGWCMGVASNLAGIADEHLVVSPNRGTPI